MGTKRIGLARMEALIENLKRELAMGAGSILSGLKGVQCISTAITASDTGTAIADGVSFVTVDADSDANHIIILPTPTPGTIVWLGCQADGTGFELQTSAPATIKLNNVSGAGKESAIPSSASLVRCVCVNATNWTCTMFNATGTEAPTPVAD